MKYSEIEEQIARDLGLGLPKKKEEKVESKKVLSESYIAQPKKYTLNTEALRTKTKEGHIELYNKYAESLNLVSADLDRIDRSQANSNYSEFRATKRAETMNSNAVYLHELYFANISDLYSEVGMDSRAYMRINRDFGTFDHWQRDYTASALSTSSGWVVTGLSMYHQRYMTVVVDGHDESVMMGFYPVIVLDMWEHARRDYLNNKQAYVEAMMLEFNWNIIEERFKRADAILEVLKK